MSWNDPERRRKVVTYGKSARNSSVHSRRPQLFSAPDDAVNAPLRSELQTRLQTPPKTYLHRPKPTSRVSTEETPYQPDPSAQDNQRNLRSPKRRKVTGDHGKQNLQNPDSPPSSKAATENADRQPQHRRLKSRNTNGLTSSDQPATESTGRGRRIANRNTEKTEPNEPLSLVSPSRNETPDSYHSQPVPDKSRRLFNREERIQPYSLSSPEPDNTAKEEPRARRRLIDSLGAHSTHEDGPTSEPETIERSPSPDVSIPAPRTPNAADSQNGYGRDETMLRSLANDNAENPTPQSISPKVTYARQRSFLSNLDFQSDLSTGNGLNAEGDLHGLPTQPTSTANVESEPAEDAKTVRSIHELRRAGVNARFQGMVDSILEDIEDIGSSASVRRNGLIQLCEKLLEDSFAQRFIESGFFVRLANSMSAKFDVIASLLSAEAYALMLRLNHLPQSVHTAFWPKLVAMAPALLPLQEGISKILLQRRFGLSRANQSAIKDVSSRSGQVAGLSDDLPLSPRRLMLHCMHLSIRKVRESEVPEILPTKVVSELISILLKLSSEHAIDEKATSKNYAILESIISILETYTTSSTSIGGPQQDALTLLTDSSHFLSSLSKANDTQSLQLLTLHLKLILNVTNANSHICEGFATPDLIHSLVTIVLSGYPSATGDSTNENKDSLDIVILALGALINLTEENEVARESILNQKEDEKESSKTLLERLLALFIEGLDTVSEVWLIIFYLILIVFSLLLLLLFYGSLTANRLIRWVKPITTSHLGTFRYFSARCA